MFSILNVFGGRTFVEQVKLQDVWVVNLYTQRSTVDLDSMPDGFCPLEVNVFTELDAGSMKKLLTLVKRPIVRRQRKFTMSDYGVFAGPGEMFDFKLPFGQWVSNVKQENAVHTTSLVAGLVVNREDE